MGKGGNAILRFLHKQPAVHLWSRFLEDHLRLLPRHSVQPQLRLSLLCPSCNPCCPSGTGTSESEVQQAGSRRGAALQPYNPPAKAESNCLSLVCPPVGNQGSGPLTSRIIAGLLNKTSISNILLSLLAFEKS